MQYRELLQQLIEDLDSAHKLLALMDAEYQALASRDLATLETLLTQKQSLLALLGQHGNARSQALIDAGFTADKNGLVAFATPLPNGTEIVEYAQKVDAALKACREANERNGRLIRNNQDAVSNMLQILQGSNQTPDLYDRRGGASRHSHNRPLSQA